MLDRVAGVMARRPLAFVLVSAAICAALAGGFVRFGVDAGQGLLVGSSSRLGRAQSQFERQFGGDPIVLVLTAKNPTAPYLERNLQRLTALEDDLTHDPRVAMVLGPGTVARSVLAATTAEVSKTLTEYPYFVAETDLLVAQQKGSTDTTKLQQQFQTDLTNARSLLALYVARAAADAHNARQTYDQKPPPASDLILDSRERAVEAAVARDALPPLFAEYLAGPGKTADQAAARQFFDRITAAFGDCDQSIAQFLQITPTCQVFLERVLLDLPRCPSYASVKTSPAFCPPKTAWAAVLPAPSVTPQGLLTREIITVRLTAAAGRSAAAVRAVQQKIEAELAHGVADDAYTRTLTAAQLQQLRQLGPLRPTECGGLGQQQDAACYRAFSDAAMASVVAGAPLLTGGVVDAMTQSLLTMFPLAMVLMAVLLVALFRVRGRLWPLLAALVGTAASIGLTLWAGWAVTPAVLAGVPILIGLGVDYSVQVVARFDEAVASGAGRREALGTAMRTAGGATATAAAATVAGLVALLALTGADLGPLAAIPLVAEFAVVLCAGVVLAWATALFVALPAAALRVAPVGHPGAGEAVPPPVRPARRTSTIADSWRGVLVPAVLVALVGWVVLPRVPVQTDLPELLAPSLPQLQAIDLIRAETGYGNEVDIYVQGQVAGPYGGGIPANVVWQCTVTEAIRPAHPGEVAMATSIADFFIGSSGTVQANASPPCAAATGGSGASSPAGTPSPTGSPAAAPSALPSSSPSAQRLGSVILAAASMTATPSARAASPGPPSAGSSPQLTPAPSASPAAPVAPVAPAGQPQTAFLCDLRLLPALARNLVEPIPSGTQPCPPVDKYLLRFLSADTTPIDPQAARIVVAVASSSVADQARLIDSLRRDLASPPGGLTAVPTGLAALAASAYTTLSGAGLLLNLVPLVAVLLVLLLLERDLRRALLPVVPTAIAAGWAPLVLLGLGRLPGGAGRSLGSFNPLTVVLGALVIALATEFGVVLLRRFDEERSRGLAPDAAAAAALAVTGRAILISALTLGGGFAVLAASALLPHGLPLLGSFGLTVLIDLALAVAAVFGIMLPLAVVVERERGGVPAAVELRPLPPVGGAQAIDPPPRRPVSGRRPAKPFGAAPGAAGPSPTGDAAASRGPEDSPPASSRPPRRPPVSGRRRRPPPQP